MTDPNIRTLALQAGLDLIALINAGDAQALLQGAGISDVMYPEIVEVLEDADPNTPKLAAPDGLDPAHFDLLVDGSKGTNRRPNLHIYQGDAPNKHSYFVEFPVLIGKDRDHTLQFELWLEAAGPRIQYTLLEVM